MFTHMAPQVTNHHGIVYKAYLIHLFTLFLDLLYFLITIINKVIILITMSIIITIPYIKLFSWKTQQMCKVTLGRPNSP